MAAPHAAAAVALIASEHPSLRHRPGALVARLQARTRSVNNHTPPTERGGRPWRRPPQCSVVLRQPVQPGMRKAAIRVFQPRAEVVS
jgi:hypothetical protein